MARFAHICASYAHFPSSHFQKYPSVCGIPKNLCAFQWARGCLEWRENEEEGPATADSGKPKIRKICQRHFTIFHPSPPAYFFPSSTRHTPFPCLATTGPLNMPKRA